MLTTRTPKVARTARVTSVMSPLSRVGRGSQHSRVSEIDEDQRLLVAIHQASTNSAPLTDFRPRSPPPPREETDDEMESHLAAIQVMAHRTISIPEYDTDMGSVASYPGDTDHEADWDSRSESQSSMYTDGNGSDFDTPHRSGAPCRSNVPSDEEFEPEDKPMTLTLEDDSPEMASLQRAVTRPQTDEDETEDDSRRESDGDSDDDENSDGGFTTSGERDAVHALDTGSSNVVTAASIRRLLRPGGISYLLGDDAARLVEEEMDTSGRRREHSHTSHTQDAPSSRDSKYSFYARAARRSRYNDY